MPNTTGGAAGSRNSSGSRDSDVDPKAEMAAPGEIALLMDEGQEKTGPKMLTVPFTKGEVQCEVGKLVRSSCLAVTYLVLAGLAIGMILVGVLPNKTPSDETVWLPSYDRTYYISAEEVNWTFTLGGKDAIWGPLVGTYVQHASSQDDVQGHVIKGRFVGYTDDSFETPAPGREPGGRWEHLGLLGPPIHCTAGETVRIVLRNLLQVPINLEPMGAQWNIDGLLAPVGSGNTVEFTIDVPREAAPPTGSHQGSRMYIYRSSQNPTRHENSGLVGPLIVSRPGQAQPDGTPKGVDREFITLFQIFNEIETEFIVYNAKGFSDNGWNTDRFTVNGHSFGTLPGLTGRTGERIRWYVGGLGSENGMHNAHWHGNVLEYDGHHTDQVTQIPAGTVVADMVAYNPGRWLYHCHVNSHLTAGMATLYSIEGDAPPPVSGGRDVYYYVAADEVDWDYLPLGGIACSLDGSVAPVEEGSVASQFLGPPEYPRVGSVWKKAMYREYTDGNFTTVKARAPEDAYLGLLGPVLRGRVGDTIHVVFRNHLTDHPASMHPHGVLYNKSSEGTPYMDGTWGADKADDAVPPNGTHEYIWAVPENAGPGPSDPSSVMWMYHSHTDEALDTWAGLAGPIIITGRDTEVDETGRPVDLDAEVTLFFAAIDESQSLFTQENIEAAFGPDQQVQWPSDDDAGDGFVEASVHHAINGFMYCNMPRLSFEAGSRVRFHYMSLGDIGDMHTPKMGQGGGFINLGQREDALQMSAGGMHSVDVLLTEPGTWELGCNVLEHQQTGLIAMYEVTPASADTIGRNSMLYQQPNGVVRTFYIQAEDVLWDYAPNKYVHCTAMNYSARAAIGGYLARTETAIGSGMYRKALFRGYTNATFAQPLEQYDYMGLLGPLIVVEPGDTLRVVLRNGLNFTNINFAPGGGLVSQHDEAAGQAVGPGEVFEYEWLVPASAGPTPSDLSSVGYGYGSTVIGSRLEHALLGLEGIMVVVRSGELVQDAASGALLPRGVDQLVPLMWQVFDENFSPFLLDNMRHAGIDPATVDVDDEDFAETNIKHTINGRMYCNLPPPQIGLNTHTRFVFLSVGSTEGLHAPVVTDFPLIDAEGAHPSAMLMPGYTSTLDMYATREGHFPMWCNVHDHVEAGMIGQMLVTRNVDNARSLPSAPMGDMQWP